MGENESSRRGGGKRKEGARGTTGKREREKQRRWVYTVHTVRCAATVCVNGIWDFSISSSRHVRLTHEQGMCLVSRGIVPAPSSCSLFTLHWSTTANSPNDKTPILLRENIFSFQIENNNILVNIHTLKVGTLQHKVNGKGLSLQPTAPTSPCQLSPPLPCLSYMYFCTTLWCHSGIKGYMYTQTHAHVQHMYKLHVHYVDFMYVSCTFHVQYMSQYRDVH